MISIKLRKVGNSFGFTVTKELILYFYDQLIQTYGGTYGIRDERLLDSALEQPKATYGGNYESSP